MGNLDVATLKGSVFDKSKARLRSIADRIAFPLTFASLHASVSGYKDLRRTRNGQTLCREHLVSFEFHDHIRAHLMMYLTIFG